MKTNFDTNITELNTNMLGFRSTERSKDIHADTLNGIETAIIQEPITAVHKAIIPAEKITDTTHCKPGESHAPSNMQLLTFKVGKGEIYNYLASPHAEPDKIASVVSRGVWRFRQDMASDKVTSAQVEDAKNTADYASSSNEEERRLARTRCQMQHQDEPAYFITSQAIADKYAKSK